MSAADKLRQSTLLPLIAKDSGLLPESLLSIILTAPLRYKEYRIPKRTGGYREIAQPAKEVKWVQRWIVEHFRGVLPIHSAATAYEPGSSIKENARRHSGGSFILKMDFRDFFPSITEGHLYNHLSSTVAGIDLADILLVTRACMRARDRAFPLRLCIGAPASPFLSNSIMYKFDSVVGDFVSTRGVAYSRYADDLTFSCVQPGTLGEVEEFVKQTVRELINPQLEINEPKTVHASRAGRRVVTGLVVTPSGELSTGRDRKRLVRSMVHRESKGLLTESEVLKLNGLINFITSIEPSFQLRVDGWRNKNVA